MMITFVKPYIFKASTKTLFILLGFLADYVTSTVEITDLYFPYYVEAGNPMSLRCTASDRKNLAWARQTALTGWRMVDIVPSLELGWRITTIAEEPSGFRESILVQQNMKLGDRGSYSCSGNSDSYSVYITTLEITKEDVIAVEKDVPIYISCSISGFDGSIPMMVYTWIKDRTQLKYNDPSYNMTEGGGKMGLKIKEPYKEDSGQYTCMFTLKVSGGDLTFEKNVTINASALPKGEGNSLHCSHIILSILIQLGISLFIPMIFQRCLT